MPERRPRGKKRTPSFVCELPLRATPRAVRAVLIRLDVGRQIYNACLQTALARLRTVRASPEWARARALPQHTEEQRTRRARAFARARKRYGLTDEALQRVALKHFRRSRWMGDHLGTHEVQKIGTRAYLAANRILVGHARSARFKGRGQFHSLEGKSNAAGIRWRGDHVEWHGLVLPALLDPEDPVLAHALTHPVKYVRIVRRRVRGIPRLYAQLVCRGRPHRKPTHRLGRGPVGVDLGPSTVAAVGPRRAILTPFCEPVVRGHRQIRVLQRRLDRQRRANNPGNYLPDGRVKPGPKTWRLSHRERAVVDRLAELHRREKAHRKTLHGQLANEVLRMGRVMHIEQTSVVSLQRTFGRSVSVRAPGMFVQILRRKAESAGGQVIDIPACAAKLSQICHGCGAIQKKPLRQRVHQCACGVEMQRDLYSAFLAAHTDGGGVLHAGRARRAWPGAEPLLRAAWRQALQPATGRPAPSTFGRPEACRSQSGSLAAEGIANAEARGDHPGRGRGGSP
jgi:putative transposase